MNIQFQSFVNLHAPGEFHHDNTGYSVSLSWDGQVLAVGAMGFDGDGCYNLERGKVRVMEFDGTNWVPK